MSKPSIVVDKPLKHECFECSYCGMMILDGDKYTCVTTDNFGSFTVIGPESVCDGCYNDAKAYVNTNKFENDVA